MFHVSQLHASLSVNQWRQAITAHYCVNEKTYIAELITWINLNPDHIASVTKATAEFLQRWHKAPQNHGLAQAFLQEYGLSSREGLILMCLAEALIRIPDTASARAFIADKIHSARWDEHIGHSPSWFVNAASRSLLWSERLLGPVTNPHNLLQDIIRRLGEPLLHTALAQAVTCLGSEFVFAPDLKTALTDAQHHLRNKSVSHHYTYSFDLLGEAAINQDVARHYQASYLQAVASMHRIKQEHKVADDHKAHAFSLSIKLSALHPRYEYSQKNRVLSALVGNSGQDGYLVTLAQAARAADIPITIDAEEADRLELSLDIIEQLMRHPNLVGWNGLGLAVQAYSKRSLPLLAYLNQLGEDLNITLSVRLVKGAYWDSEIQWAQRAGIADYPVFTQKAATDISYLACAKFLLQVTHLFPQFATHNAQTMFSILSMAGFNRRFEFQRLHGMGESIYRQLLSENPDLSCRIYAPVGNHAELLPYLVRRLLENGANTSFIHQVSSATINFEHLTAHPINMLELPDAPIIPLPSQMFNHENPLYSRINSRGSNMAIESLRNPLLDALEHYRQYQWHAYPIINNEYCRHGPGINCTSPIQSTDIIGSVNKATSAQAKNALANADAAQMQWRLISATERALYLEKIASLYESNTHELLALLIREAGKTINDAIDEVREAIDFFRYYAQQARAHLDKPQQLPGPTGEQNELRLEGRGIFICLSPWNFPLAIFTGQIAAALVAGNCVIAKPARQTSLIAFRAVELMLAAGIPGAVLQFLPGNSDDLAPVLMSDPRVSGVAFTGSTESAWSINRNLAARNSSIATFIAETGGQNAMIADSTTLPEQLVKDVIRSAFSSAGQRCSALRVLYIQKDIAETVINLLSGAIHELTLGDPFDLSTDVGPIIDRHEQQKLLDYIDIFRQKNMLLAQTFLPENITDGFFVPPTLVEINSLGELTEEHFGPICHLICFEADELDQIIEDINRIGFGLTLGIHTRNEQLAQNISRRANVGNIYINRNMIGAVVGVQPFGGCGLSGTGPKAGGPHYLLRFTREKTVSNYVAAVGGNIQLIMQKNGEVQK